jgi:hypothetical protein
MSTTWFKFPVSFFKEARTLKLRRQIGDAAYWVPVAIWAFAASQDGAGDLSDYEPSELADEIRYKGDPDALIKALTPDFLDNKRCVVGWTEMFKLAESRKRHADNLAAKRRATLPSSLPSQKRGEEIRPEESESRSEHHALHDASPNADTHSQAVSAFSLTEAQRSDVRKEFRMPIETVINAERVYRENKTPYIAKDGALSFEGFKGWLRTTKDGKNFISIGRPGPAVPAMR